MPVLVSVEPGAAVEEHEVALVDKSSSPYIWKTGAHKEVKFSTNENDQTP